MDVEEIYPVDERAALRKLEMEDLSRGGWAERVAR